MTFALIAYGTATLGFVALNLLLLIRRRGDPFGYRLNLASALSAVWTGAVAIAESTPFDNATRIVDALEIVRDAG
jgi:hypothetical protein